MSIRAVYRYVNLTLSPETAPEAPGILHSFLCMSCAEVGPCDEDFEAARDWTYQHSGRNPSHTGYQEIIHRFWRMTRE